MKANPYEAYRKSNIETSSPGRLVVLCFEAMVRHMRLFSQAVRERKIEEAHHAAIKAQRILLELSLALDSEKGGDIAAILRRTYDRLRYRMVDANLKKDAAAGDEIAKDLDDLRITWDEIYKKEAGNV